MAYKANPHVKVKHSTIAELRKLGMKKALEKANKGGASDEYMEAAKRFYGSRVKDAPKKSETKYAEGRTVDPKSLPKTKEKSAVVGETPTKMRVYKEPKKKKTTWQKTWGRLF